MNEITSEPIFSSEELERNQVLKDELFELISSEDAILFVGSGLSIPVGYPSWDALLVRLETLAQKVDSDFSPNQTLRESSPLDYASFLRKVFEKADEATTYFNELTTIFSRPERGPSFKDHHKKLVQLPFSLIMTTNYDPVLSEALLKSIQENNDPLRTDLCFSMNEDTIPQLSNFLLSLHKGMSNQKQIAHIHGYHNRPKEIILTKQDYERYYFNRTSEQDGEQETTIHFLVLWALIATRRIVFFGFGMKDPYLLQLLEDVRKRLWRWDKPTHINIASICDKTASEVKTQATFLKEKYGVDTYFYENKDQSHKQLEVLIEELYQSCCHFDDASKTDEKLQQGTPSDDSGKESKKIEQLLEDATGSATGEMPSWISSTNKKLNMDVKDENK